jgi:integrase
MATIRELRGRWQAQVRRRGMAPKAKSFDTKADAERWARTLETEIDRSGAMPDMRALIVLALETGMRRGELVGLTWQHVDLEARIAHLPLTKNGEARDVPLSTRAIETLKVQREVSPGDRVFAATGHAVELAWAHLHVRAECPDLRFHDLRHEAVSRLFERGLNVMEVGTISGHKELRMLQRYTHLRAADLVGRLQ